MRKVKSAETDRCLFDLVVLASGCTGAEFEALAGHAEGVCRTLVCLQKSHAEDEVFDLCLKSGMQGILQKPFRQKELLRLLENYQRESLK